MSRFTFDAVAERVTRRLAGGLSRRSALARFGGLMAAAPLLPILPVARAEAEPVPPPVMPPQIGAPESAFTRNAQAKDAQKCDYWRYCAIDGLLCTCCGGGVHSCPPGTSASPTSWVGTCIKPDDGKSYLIAYRDCCGTDACRTKCYCDSTERETPVYRPQGDNNVIWCFGLSTMTYHCSTAVLVGPAE